MIIRLITGQWNVNLRSFLQVVLLAELLLTVLLKIGFGLWFSFVAASLVVSFHAAWPSVCRNAPEILRASQQGGIATFRNAVLWLRKPRFSVRNLLLGTALVSLVMALFVPHAKRVKHEFELIQDEHGAVRQLRATGAWVFYDYRSIDDNFMLRRDKDAPPISWIRTHFGIEGTDVTYVRMPPNKNVSDAAVNDLLRFKTLEALDLRGTAISDECLLDLQRFPKLKSLLVSKNQISAKAISEFKKAAPNCAVDRS